MLEEKNRLIRDYRNTATFHRDLQAMRDTISAKKAEAKETLDDILLEEFKSLGVRYEQSTWNAATGTESKPQKRALTLADVQALNPLHWGYEFDEVLNGRGGFDAIIANPPWEIFKPHAKEFFAEHSDLVTKNKMTIKEFEEKQTELLQDREIRAAWLEYLSQFPHTCAYYRSAKQYENQISVVNGKKAGTDINLYKLFVEQCYNLLRPGGQCGIVLPSGLYTDLGTKQIRELLFGHTRITGMFCFENRKEIFEGVHRSFKFIVLTFEKAGRTETFPAAFMRHDVAELTSFPRHGALDISVELVRRLSPNSLSVTEYKNAIDVFIAEKLFRHPILGQWRNGSPLQFSREFMSSDDHHKFNYTGDGLIVYEGKMFEQFTSNFDKPQWWMTHDELKKTHFFDRGDWKQYRFAIRRIASNTNNRTLIASILPRNTVVVHSVFVNVKDILPPRQALYLVGLLNSFVLDFVIRSQVTSNVSQFFVHQLPVPRPTEKDASFAPIVERAARLICTTTEFDDLAREVGLTPLPPATRRGHAVQERGGMYAAGGNTLLASAPQLFAPPQPALGDAPDDGDITPPAPIVYGVMEVAERARLRAELDGLIAHLYGLSHDEFAHILASFPLVADSVKTAALCAYRDVSQGKIV